jgi:energy-coupling factor transport system substrate-specific component
MITGNKMTDKDKISKKDLITIAIFSVIFTIMQQLAAMLSVIVVLFPFCIAIMLLLCGTVWVFLTTKIPKRFCILIQCIIISLLSFFTGKIWTIPLSILTGGVMAEIISNLGKRNNFIISAAAYAAFGLCLHFGIFGIILFAHDYWKQYASKMGANEILLESIYQSITRPLLGISCVAVILCAILGILLGRYILRKHFIKAGIV